MFVVFPPYDIWLVLIGLLLIGAAIFSPDGSFRWGRYGSGPLVEPQWAARLFLAIFGTILLLVYIFKLV